MAEIVVHHEVTDFDMTSSYYTKVLGFEQVDSRSVSGDVTSEILSVDDADVSVVMHDANRLQLVEFPK